MRHAWILTALWAGCAASPCELGLDDAKKAVRDPAKLHAYFVDQIRCGEYAKAYDCFSTPAKQRLGPYVGGPFYFVIQWEIVRRMITGFEQHDVRVNGPTATVRWCNGEFGLSREFRLIGQAIGGRILWGYDFTKEQLEEMKDRAFEWFRRQKEVADGRLHTYPPDWRFTPLGPRCSCKRGSEISHYRSQIRSGLTLAEATPSR